MLGGRHAERDGKGEGGAFSGPAANLEYSAEKPEAFTHSGQPEGAPGGHGFPYAKPDSVIFHAKPQLSIGSLSRKINAGGAGMARGVVQTFLGEPVGGLGNGLGNVAQGTERAMDFDAV